MIENLNIEEDLNKIKKYSLFNARLIYHFAEFNFNDLSLNALCCILNGFQSYKESNQIIDTKVGIFLKEWISYLINESEFEIREIITVTKQVKFAKLNYSRFPNIENYIERFHGI